MKTVIKAIVIATVLASPVFAYDGHKLQMKGEGMMMGMMSNEQIMEIHQHMQDMQSLMENIKKEANSRNRQKMMGQHMDMMQGGMHMMNSQGGMMGGKSEMKNMSKNKDLNMEKRMGMMEDHMNMMQMMMGQMMEHKAEEKK